MKITETGVPREEQETVCVYDKYNEQWMIESTVRKHITKLMKQYDDVEVVEGYENGTPTYVRVVLKEDLISFRKPISQARKDKMSQVAKERFGK